jgi:C-methyltransferase
MAHASHAPPAHVQLMGLIAGKWLSQPLYVLADLRVCDELAAGPLTTAELAPRVGADPGTLYRLMRVAAALGLFTEEDGRFRLLPLGEPLRSDVPCSIRDLTVFLGSRPTWESFAAILHTARTGSLPLMRCTARTFSITWPDNPNWPGLTMAAWLAWPMS